MNWTGMTIQERNQMLLHMKAKDVNKHFQNLQVPKDEQKKMKQKRRTEKNR